MKHLNLSIVLVIFLISWSSMVCDDGWMVAVQAQSESNITTHLSAWFDRPYYQLGDEIKLNISVWDDNSQPVITGVIQVVDLNSSNTAQATVTGITTAISLYDSSGLAGIHLLEVSYNDSTGYYAVSTLQLKILIGSQITAGGIATATELDFLIYTVTVGQPLSVDGTLELKNSLFPFFYIDEKTACLFLEATISGQTHILSADYPHVDITASLSFSLPFILPPWIQLGPISASCGFSGSFESDLDSSEFIFTLHVIPSGKALVMEPSSYEIERNNLTEQHSLILHVQVPGYDGEQLTIDVVLSTLSGEPVAILLDEKPVTSYSSDLSVSFSYDIPVGTYNLTGILRDWYSGAELASTSFLIAVIDGLMLDNFYWNLTSGYVVPGQAIQGYLVSREEDTFQAQQSVVEIRDRASGLVLFNGMTSNTGYIFFTFTIPGDFQPGIHNIDFELFPVPGDLYHNSCLRSLAITYRKTINIQHQEDQTLVRGRSYWFNASIIDSDGFPIAVGMLSLLYDSKILYESSDVRSANYLFLVPLDFKRGINMFEWKYSGTDVYEELAASFPVSVYSVPQFDNVSLISEKPFAGDDIQLAGYLIDEIDQPVTGASIKLNHTDNWGNVIVSQVTTTQDGLFTFTITLESTAAGHHSFTLDCLGWNEEFYQPVKGKYFLEVFVSPQITVSYSGEIVSGENTTFSVTGKSESSVTLDYFNDDSWQALDEIILDSEGRSSYTWPVPANLQGPVMLRARYVELLEYSYFPLKLKKRPVIAVNVPILPTPVGEEVIITVTSTERYSIWMDGIIWKQDILAGSHQYSLKFINSGDHEIVVISTGEYIVETIVNKTISVRVDYLVNVEYSPRVQGGDSFNVFVHLETNDHQFLEGFTVRLLANDSLIASTVTSQHGNASLNASLNRGYYSLKIEIIPLRTLIYFTKNIVPENGLTIYDLPEIAINEKTPITGTLTGVEIKITSGTDPVTEETAFLFLRNSNMEEWLFLGTGTTDEQGKAVVWWNVTQNSGEYYLQARNKGKPFLEAVTKTKTIQILNRGPEILVASISLISNDNVFQAISIVSFPNGIGTVYLYSDQSDTYLGILEHGEGDYWALQVQLEPGQYQLSIKAVDAKGIESWKDLDPLVVSQGTGKNDPSNRNGNLDLGSILIETALSTILLVPVAGWFIYKKKKALAKAEN
ncbi:MAG: hypothetical protein ACFFD4_13310 [Candidatus Odinarchaeota archaeon]